jgi:hypothetical protein
MPLLVYHCKGAMTGLTTSTGAAFHTPIFATTADDPDDWETMADDEHSVLACKEAPP